MDRRAFVRAGLAAAVPFGGTARARSGSRSSAVARQDERPAYADWIPDTSHVGEDRGVHFTHLDWETQDALQAAIAGSGGDPGIGTNPGWTRVLTASPILSQPLAGTETTPTALTVISRYPFSDDLTAATERERPTAGIDVRTTTWTGELFVFHGDFDPALFDDRYTADFELVAEPGDFTVYVGTSSDNSDLSYAVSGDTLVVGLEAARASDDTATVVTDPIDRTLEERDRVIDTADGRWLFDAAGAGHLGVGGWHLDEPLIALGTADGGAQESDDSIEVERLSGGAAGVDGASTTRRAAVQRDEEPDIAAAESFTNTVTVTTTDGAVDGLVARFAAIYPEGSVPSGRTVRSELIGVPALPHDIAIDDGRVFATARLDTWTGTKA